MVAGKNRSEGAMIATYAPARTFLPNEHCLVDGRDQTAEETRRSGPSPASNRGGVQDKGGVQLVNIYSIIRRAIVNKEQVIATYNGHLREMCPHVLGKKGGRDQALFYQFGGASSSGLGPAGSADNWRCIQVDKLTNVTTRKGPWYTAPNHSRPQTCVDQIDVEVTY